MLARLIDWSLRNVFLVLLATAFAVAAGIYALARTPVDAIPDLSDAQVIVFARVSRARRRRSSRTRSPTR